MRIEFKNSVHRFASRTHLLEKVLDRELFHGVHLSSISTKRTLIINTTELRTGSAFRFSQAESGSWRWGRIRPNDVTVAHAVAASAAYPLFLPSFDETFEFELKGHVTRNRVTLSDGGIYDNLGLGPLWPDRDPDISLNVAPVDFVICCSAGYGLRKDLPTQFLFSRMNSVFNAIFDRAQNAAMHRLHATKASKSIAGFILPYLGQNDAQLPNLPDDLVPRTEAHSYPTNFNAMSDEWIDRLSLRGEQITKCLVRAYVPEIVH